MSTKYYISQSAMYALGDCVIYSGKKHYHLCVKSDLDDIDKLKNMKVVKNFGNFFGNKFFTDMKMSSTAYNIVKNLHYVTYDNNDTWEDAVNGEAVKISNLKPRDSLILLDKLTWDMIKKNDASTNAKSVVNGLRALIKVDKLFDSLVNNGKEEIKKRIESKERDIAKKDSDFNTKINNIDKKLKLLVEDVKKDRDKLEIDYTFLSKFYAMLGKNMPEYIIKGISLRELCPKKVKATGDGNIKFEEFI